MIKHTMYGKLSITRFVWHLAIFGKLFCCRLINIFLTQFWNTNLLIHKPQPRHMIFHSMYSCANPKFPRCNTWRCLLLPGVACYLGAITCVAVTSNVMEGSIFLELLLVVSRARWVVILLITIQTSSLELLDE